ncbi:hypothetical protein B0T13DRAFT_449455 [Neurospora crassa]|nr:hypothetical protein B0T13DRAFT_449455 [Neurospora crassa]
MEIPFVVVEASRSPCNLRRRKKWMRKKGICGDKPSPFLIAYIQSASIENAEYNSRLRNSASRSMPLSPLTFHDHQASVPGRQPAQLSSLDRTMANKAQSLIGSAGGVTATSCVMKFWPPINGRQATGFGLLYWPSDAADLDATLAGLQNSLLTRPDMEMIWGSTEASKDGEEFRMLSCRRGKAEALVKERQKKQKKGIAATAVQNGGMR